MAKTAQIVVVGSSNTDMVVRVPRLPRPGETVLGGQFAQVPGGKGSNQAVAAARLGANVTLIARVGQDALGEETIHNLQAEGIHTEHIGRDPDFPTGVALIGVDETTGENAILVAPGANAALTVADIDRAASLIKSADVLVCQMEVRLDVVIAALETAHKAGVLTILNPAPAAPLPDYAWEYVSVLTPNETEAATLAGGATEDVHANGKKLLEQGIGQVILTLGARGAIILQLGQKTERVPGFSVSQVVDTTAAGDCFTGALAVALGEGIPPGRAAWFAASAATISVTRAGAQPSLPTRVEADAMLADAYAAAKQGKIIKGTMTLEVS
jgi:ribokinase